MSKTKDTIKGIYPLTYMQQTLLIHSLSQDRDQGFLQVQCKLKGPLNYDLLRDSWQRMVELHPVLKSSIHWEQIEKPVMVVHSTAKIPWQYLNWDKETRNRQAQLLSEFREQDKRKGFKLSKAPLTRLSLIKYSDNEHVLIWSCHHILFDGWSSGVIFSDLFDCYQALSAGKTFQQDPAPSYRTYLNWLKKQDPEKAKIFWTNQLGNLEQPTLVGEARTKTRSIHMQQRSIMLEKELTAGISGYLKHNRITLSSLVLSIWSILLARLTRNRDIVFGTTVSGRSSGFPEIDRMTGLFMNVVPVRQDIKPGLSFLQMVRTIQKTQAETGTYDYVDQDKIMGWIDWPVHQPLFNTLVIIQNLVWQDRQVGELQVAGAKGDLTTTYPLTLVVRPGDQLEVVWCYDKNIIGESQLKWLSEGISGLLERVIQNADINLDSLLEGLEEPDQTHETKRNGSIKTNITAGASFPGYQAPTNSLELKLTKIWEEIFDKYPIGINDDFFQIGGHSMMAMKLVYRIEEKIGVKISPSILIQNPTIAAMARSLPQPDSSNWSSLVPMRARGSKPPLFVIHGGGGHVFFYHPLTRYLDSEQPVYALQPLGLEGDQEKHSSIEEMARHYLEVIRQVQPEGPYSILGTCFSDPVCYEMAQQLEQAGKGLHALIIVDSAPTHLFPRKKVRTPMDVRKQRFKQRFRSNPAKAIEKVVVDRVVKLLKRPKERWLQLTQRYSFDPRKRKLLSLQENLMNLYFQYQWEPYPGEITLIQTSQNVQRINNHDDQVWQKLAQGGVHLLEAAGSHRSRFEEPDVIALARCLQDYLDSTYKYTTT